jgi:hypothetical protein
MQRVDAVCESAIVQEGGDTLLETAVGRMSDGTWTWRARGPRVAAFGRVYAPIGAPGIAPDGWLYVGPFRTRRAAMRDVKAFERGFMKTCHPNVDVEPAPDPRSLN